jgi:hypothetical protein
VPGFEADIPEQADEALEAFLVVAGGLVGEQDQQVDVGTRKKLASPVSAGRDQCGFGRGRGLAPDFLEGSIDQSRVFAQQTRGASPAMNRSRSALRPSCSSARQRSCEATAWSTPPSTPR